MKYRAEVDHKVCISTGACYSIDKTHFEPGKNEQSIVVGGETDDSKSTGTFDDDSMTNAQEAANSCPVSAIKITIL